MTAPLQATNTASMSVATAGQVRVEINTGTLSSPTWTEIKGIQQWGPKFEQVTEDDTDVSSGGWKSEFPVGNGMTISVSGLVKGTEDPSFVVDPGVQALLDASKTYGKAGVSHLRYWRTDDIAEAYEIFTTTKVSLSDDKPPALQKFSGDLTVKGAPTEISKPTGEAGYKVTLGTPTAGNFTLTYQGKTTANIAYNATATAVKSALVALDDGYGSSDFDVTGAGTVADPYIITTPGGTLTGSGTGLTGGSFAVASA